MIPPSEQPKVPASGSVETFPFALSGLIARGLALVNVRPSTAAVQLDAERDLLDVRFGLWRVVTTLGNVKAAEAGGPFSAWKVLGARLSLADRGLTFGTTTVAGVCIQFHDPVPGIEPFGLLRHPSLTVTVDDPAALLGRLSATTRGT